MIAAEYAAVEAQLEADSALVVRDTVYDPAGAIVRGSYVVLFGGSPDDLDDDRFSNVPDLNSKAEYVYTTRSVSTTPDGVRAVQTHVFTQLVGTVLTVTDRKCDPLRHTHGDDIQADASVKPPLFYADDEWTLVSRRP